MSLLKPVTFYLAVSLLFSVSPAYLSVSLHVPISLLTFLPPHLSVSLLTYVSPAYLSVSLHLVISLRTSLPPHLPLCSPVCLTSHLSASSPACLPPHLCVPLLICLSLSSHMCLLLTCLSYCTCPSHSSPFYLLTCLTPHLSTSSSVSLLTFLLPHLSVPLFTCLLAVMQFFVVSVKPLGDSVRTRVVFDRLMFAVDTLLQFVWTGSLFLLFVFKWC